VDEAHWSRTRRTGFWFVTAVTSLLAVLWVVSQFRGFALLHTNALLVRNDQFPDGQMGAWEYTMTTWSLQTYPHQLRLVTGDALSVMSTQEEKDRFADRLGWESHSFPARSIRADRRPWFSSDPADWRVLGLGVTTRTAGAQSARIVDVPYWLLIAMFGVPALMGAKRIHTSRVRQRDGRCLKCGYQLDAVMTKCPECGTNRAVAQIAN
jgi:hypothetical protein